MSKKLKPCPFCGGEAKLHTQILGSTKASFIHCQQCNATVPMDDDEQIVIDTWNRRTLTPQQQHADELFHELERYLKDCEDMAQHLKRAPENWDNNYPARKALIEKIKSQEVFHNEQ